MEISSLEQRVMLAILALQPEAYGVEIQNHIEARTGHSPSAGSIYAALDRLEQKGYLKSRHGAATPERGGKKKLFFFLTAPGQHALRQSLQHIASLQRGLRWKESLA